MHLLDANCKGCNLEAAAHGSQPKELNRLNSVCAPADFALEFSVSVQRNKTHNSYLERVRGAKRKVCRRCDALVDDCRERLIAANSNEPGSAEFDQVNDELA
jgi:hypothetical protein